MSAKTFIDSQLMQIQHGGRAVLFKKTRRTLQILLKLPLYIIFVPVVLVMRLMRPWLLVRWCDLNSRRIGHLAGNTEQYFCERDAGINVPQKHHVDLSIMAKPISNQQLVTMWKRVLRVWPDSIPVRTLRRVNQLIPGGSVHVIDNTQGYRDVHNLLDRFPPHLKFAPDEEDRGEAGIRAMGVSPDTPFVCLIVRDSAYLDAHEPEKDWNYHNCRDSDIQNYVLAAEELADRGYFVIRMGAKVKAAMKTAHPKIIDYATNGIRSDFMDIYLGSKSVSFAFQLVWDGRLFQHGDLEGPWSILIFYPLGIFIPFQINSSLLQKDTSFLASTGN